jgi:hypothetical protein
MFNRDKAINELVGDCYDIIKNGCEDYLIDLLSQGHKGFNDWTDEELMQELEDRDISYLFEESDDE